jgi:3-methylcrotonyl-CoA carboxylase alpha subunit
VKLREGNRVHEIAVHPGSAGEGDAEVVIDGRPQQIRLVRLGGGRYVLEAGARREAFHCVREGALVHLFWRGAVYSLVEEREGARPAQRSEDGRIEAPMPGKVTAIKVAPGQAVVKGQELLVVEAMKMENALRAPRDGRVKEVRARLGEMVSPGVVLVELE